MRQTSHAVNWTELARTNRVSRRKPSPPLGLNWNATIGALTWQSPSDTSNITHYRLYDGVTLKLVRELPVGQTRLQDNLIATIVVLVSYNQPLDRESSPVFLRANIRPPVTVGEGANWEAHWDDENSPLFVGTDKSNWRIAADVPVGKQVRLLRWGYTNKEACLSGTTEVDVFMSEDGAVNWDSIYNPSDRPKLTVGENLVVGDDTTFAITILPRDCLLRVDQLSVGVRAGWSGLTLYGVLEDEP